MKIVKCILGVGAAIALLAVVWALALASGTDLLGSANFLLINAWNWGPTTPDSHPFQQAHDWTSIQQMVAQLLLHWMASFVATTEPIGLELSILATLTLVYMYFSCRLVKTWILSSLGLIGGQVLTITNLTPPQRLLIKTWTQYMIHYVKSVALLYIGLGDPINIYTWPLRVLASFVLAWTSMCSGASGFTTVAAAVSPLVLAHDVGLLTNLEQAFLKPLIFFGLINTAPIQLAPQSFYFSIVATQIGFITLKGSLVCLMVDDPHHFWLVLWVLMAIDAAWLKKTKIPGLRADDLSKEEKQKLAFDVTKHTSVWGVIWSLPSIGLGIKSLTNY